MFRWLKSLCSSGIEWYWKRKIVRLQAEHQRLKEEIERATGKPVELSREEKLRLAEKSKGIDPEFLKEHSLVDPAELAELRQQAENR